MAAITENDVCRAITTFVVKNFLFGDSTAAPEPDTSLMETGFVDSTGMMELLTFVEDEYGVGIGNDELTPDNLDSVRRIAGFVVRKKGG
jgi:acyl carrier protein